MPTDPADPPGDKPGEPGIKKTALAFLGALGTFVVIAGVIVLPLLLGCGESTATPRLPSDEVSMAASTRGPAESSTVTVREGRHVVGIDITPGRYQTRATGPTGPCRWSRALERPDSAARMLAQGRVAGGPAVLTVQDGDVLTLSGGCVWTTAP